MSLPKFYVRMSLINHNYFISIKNWNKNKNETNQKLE